MIPVLKRVDSEIFQDVSTFKYESADLEGKLEELEEKLPGVKRKLINSHGIVNDYANSFYWRKELLGEPSYFEVMGTSLSLSYQKHSKVGVRGRKWNFSHQQTRTFLRADFDEGNGLQEALFEPDLPPEESIEEYEATPLFSRNNHVYILLQHRQDEQKGDFLELGSTPRELTY